MQIPDMQSMSKEVQRNLIVGDEWIYYKIYSGPKSLDDILIYKISPILNFLINKKIIDRWFFVRFYDPEHHLRLRLRLTSKSQIGEVISHLNQILKEYIAQDVISRVQLDTYQREIERYGQNTIELSEELFYYESKMIVDFLYITSNEERKEDLRWLFALKAIDSHLDLFQYSDEQKLHFLEKLKTSYRKMFDESNFLTKQLSKKYRTNKHIIEEFLNQYEHNQLRFDKLLIDKKNKTINLANEIDKLRKESKLQVDFDALNADYIHMLMNRIFKSKNNLHEMVCYDFLFQYTKSKAARLKRSSGS